ncbi:hypothetical protein IFM89_010257 [Coptis chinensis]|uniref:Protein kinase domain-containing protein n=1 Tax=Coptis chinensis TaxID=261450 RepID=A0A835HS03_9MAGN|nr:hypothetical protein IFM89_010257 [Coptis chinensis]
MANGILLLVAEYATMCLVALWEHCIFSKSDIQDGDGAWITRGRHSCLSSNHVEFVGPLKLLTHHISERGRHDCRNRAGIFRQLAFEFLPKFSVPFPPAVLSEKGNHENTKEKKYGIRLGDMGLSGSIDIVTLQDIGGLRSISFMNNSFTGDLIVVNEKRGLFGLPDLMKAAVEVLGNGSLGSAYKAVMTNGVAVVVKRIRNMNKLGKDGFDIELRRLGGLHHRNILTPLAYHYRKEEKLVVNEIRSH